MIRKRTLYGNRAGDVKAVSAFPSASLCWNISQRTRLRDCSIVVGIRAGSFLEDWSGKSVFPVMERVTSVKRRLIDDLEDWSNNVTRDL